MCFVLKMYPQRQWVVCELLVLLQNPCSCGTAVDTCARAAGLDLLAPEGGKVLNPLLYYQQFWSTKMTEHFSWGQVSFLKTFNLKCLYFQKGKVTLCC